ncbi:T9SS type A sorting domain-containing protein [uncultured Winogradskyella sp.]|uniref:T9SS type A sorting domain-containing protein n=1 Tax=uncultured Winogradskyella sp. TaxID=395353 RepID=UPI00351566AE
MIKKYLFLVLLCPVVVAAQTIITATEPVDLSVYDGTPSTAGQGEYQVFLGTDNVLDKPIIFVDGFDPGDTRDITTIYNSLEYTSTSGTQNLADIVRAEGFDLVILNFPTYVNGDGATIDGGADFMERNAMVLVELIATINADKAGNSGEPNVIIGPSMGGIISRYALNYMEANSIDADTRLFISFDSPHLGANIPIGLQHQLNYLAFNDLNPVVDIQPLITDFLNSPAARQLLTDHFEAHLLTGSAVEFDPNLTLPAPHPYRTTFQNRITSFTADGFPSNVRNVGIVNGSGIGSPYFAIGNSGTTVNPGFTVMNTTLSPNVPFTNIDILINFTPMMNTTAVVSNIIITFFGSPIAVSTAQSEAFEMVSGIDAAPGGLFDLSALTGAVSGDPLANDFINALQVDKFNFIPTVSALALVITDDTPVDWYHNIDLSGSRATTNETPFDNTFIPDENEPHVQLTEANVTFALTEILTPPLSTSDATSFDLKLEKNPVQSELVLLTSKQSNATATITDITGKRVLQSDVVLSNRTVLPLNLKSGFYILQLSTGDNSVVIKKFIVN